MAGTARSSVGSSLTGLELTPFLTGREAGGLAGFGPWDVVAQGVPEPIVAELDGVDGSGAATRVAAGGFAAAAHTPTARASVTALLTAPEIMFWELVHALPRTKLAFGNIITQAELDYELYNAHRDSSAQENAITINALPGIELPDNTPPVVLQAQQSLFDPATTTNDDGANLGTIVKTVVRALQDGLPSFDSDIIFDFAAPKNDPVLLISGTRINFVPFVYETDLEERLEFLTDVQPALSGKEKRDSPRKQPRQFFKVLYKLEDPSRQRMRALMFDWQGPNNFGFPVQPDELRLTAAVSAGATQYQVTGADEVDLRIGGQAVVVADDVTFDILNLTAVTPTLITAANPSVNGYPVGTSIYPLRVAAVPGDIQTRRSAVNLEQFAMVYQVVDNDTGALTGSTTPGFWSLHTDGRILFDDCNVLDNQEMPGELSRRVYRIDNKVGVIDLSSSWDRNKHLSFKNFLPRNRLELLQLRRLFIAVRGRQKAFWLPNFADDLTVVAQLLISTNTMDVTAINYTRFVRNRLPMSLFRITFTDGTSLVRTVQSSTVVSSTVERLTLDANWPATRAASEVQRVEFYELVRFDSDAMVFRYPRVGLARVRMPVIRVFDDN